MWGIPKAVLRGKSIVIQYYSKKQDKSAISNLILQIKYLKKKVTRRKENKKIREKIEDRERKKRTIKNNVTESWFSER